MTFEDFLIKFINFKNMPVFYLKALIYEISYWLPEKYLDYASVTNPKEVISIGYLLEKTKLFSTSFIV